MSHQNTNNEDPDFPSANEMEAHEFECDAAGCRETFEGDGRFTEVWQEARRDGWRARQNGLGEWQHFCPDHAR